MSSSSQPLCEASRYRRRTGAGIDKMSRASSRLVGGALGEVLQCEQGAAAFHPELAHHQRLDKLERPWDPERHDAPYMNRRWRWSEGEADSDGDDPEKPRAHRQRLMKRDPGR